MQLLINLIERILDVLGMNDTKINLSDNDVKYGFPVGHLNGSEFKLLKSLLLLQGLVDYARLQMIY